MAERGEGQQERMKDCGEEGIKERQLGRENKNSKESERRKDRNELNRGVRERRVTSGLAKPTLE